MVGANWYRFRSGERIRYEHVASVSFIWVVHGSGVIISNGRDYAMTDQAILGLPWMHDVEYRPDDRTPFQLGTIHVVPRHEAHVPVVPAVAFLDTDPLLRSPYRHGVDGAELPRLSSPRSTSGRRVIMLGGYCVERLADGFDVEVFAALGRVILAESRRWRADPEQADGTPVTLELMINHVLAHLAAPLTVADIAAAGGCSQATAERLFARHTGRSVLSWVRQQRMRSAAELLRTTGLRVNEVAREVGYPDPLYFSRVFRAAFGTPPSRYARGRIRP